MKLFNKIIRVAGLALVVSVIAASCKKGGVLITNPPVQSSFAGVKTAAYYITSDPNGVFQIPVGLTSPSGKDTKITVKVTSPTGAAAGTQYTLPSTTVTIPAGQVIDSLPIKGIFAGYQGNRTDTLIFVIGGGDVPATSYNDTLRLILQQYCAVVLSDFTGAYANANDFQTGSGNSGSYPVTVSSVTSTGPTSGTIVVQNLAAGFFGPFVGTDGATTPGISVNLDWSNPAKFTTTISPSQFLYKDPTYGNATIKAVGSGTFSACANTFTLNYTVTVSLGSFGNFTTTLVR